VSVLNWPLSYLPGTRRPAVVVEVEAEYRPKGFHVLA